MRDRVAGCEPLHRHPTTKIALALGYDVEAALERLDS
jgi:hypothetical protein